MSEPNDEDSWAEYTPLDVANILATLNEHWKAEVVATEERMRAEVAAERARADAAEAKLGLYQRQRDNAEAGQRAMSARADSAERDLARCLNECKAAWGHQRAMAARVEEEEARARELEKLLHQVNTVIQFYAVTPPQSASERPQRPCDIQAYELLNQIAVLAKEAPHA